MRLVLVLGVLAVVVVLLVKYLRHWGDWMYNFIYLYNSVFLVLHLALVEELDGGECLVLDRVKVVDEPQGDEFLVEGPEEHEGVVEAVLGHAALLVVLDDVDYVELRMKTHSQSIPLKRRLCSLNSLLA